VESVLAKAAGRFTEQFPGVSVKLLSRDWDDLLRQLRSRELDFFVAEISTLHREPDLEIVPMPTAHPFFFAARAGHPLLQRRNVSVSDALEWPFVTPGRVPPRILDPMLAAHRATAGRSAATRPFPSIECNALAPVKQIVIASDAITATVLYCIATELTTGQLVLLAREPWMYLHYGVVSLKGLPRTQVAERFLEYVLDAERETALEEQRLIARFDPGPARRRRVRKT
jgi:DNA-binding transcriptional LysR family regulator